MFVLRHEESLWLIYTALSGGRACAQTISSHFDGKEDFCPHHHLYILYYIVTVTSSWIWTVELMNLVLWASGSVRSGEFRWVCWTVSYACCWSEVCLFWWHERLSCHCLSLHSNNMLYPKEDKENRILLYAVSYLLAYLCMNCHLIQGRVLFQWVFLWFTLSHSEGVQFGLSN